MPDIVTTKVWTDGERGVTASKMNQIISGASIQPSFVSGQPAASSTVTGDSLLLLKAAGTYAKIDSSAFASSMVPLLPDPNPNIWSQRLRSYSSVGNPNFECNQRLTGGTLAVNGFTWMADRWMVYNNTGIAPYWNQASGQVVDLPGTSFRISSCFANFSTLSVSKPALAAGDQLVLQNNVEGCVMRELMDDVTSISILAQTNVAGGLKFAVSLRDSGATRSLVKLCIIPTPNVWTLIQLPNIPTWASGGGWSVAPGAVGYSISICVAAGSTATAPANDTWQNGNFIGAVGMDNILSKPNNSSLFLGMVQHEPGPLCSTFMDKPFAQNYDECLRYYCKSYEYTQTLGAASISLGRVGLIIPTGFTTVPAGTENFPKPMAKLPTLAFYSDVTGTANAVRDQNSGNDRGISGSIVSTRRISQLTLASAGTAGGWVTFQYGADTGW